MALLDVLIRPPQVPRAVDRPRLRALLGSGEEPACLLVAPPGSGKTVAAAQLLREAGGREGVRTGWCRFAPGMSGAGDLVRLVGATLGRDGGGAGTGVVPADRARPGGDTTDPTDTPVAPVTPLERAAALLDALGEGPTVLVVDDYDLARPEECDAVLAEVLALAPPACRIVVCSATRPIGLLGRASIGQVRLVGADELAFTEDEVAALLQRLGRDRTLAAGLHTASAGWATAVTVLAESAIPPAPGPIGPTDASAPSAAEHGLPADPATPGAPDRVEEADSAPLGGAAGGGLATAAALGGSEPVEAAARRGLAAARQADLGAAVEVVLDRAGLGHGVGRDPGGSGGDEPRGTDLLAALVLVPALGPAEVAALRLDPQRLVELAGTSALLRPVGDRWALLDLVRRPLQRRLGPERLRAAAGRLAPVLADTDPVAAAGLLMDVGDHAAAADLLARRASAVSPEAALPLLYRLPADVRRRLPPLLSAARATVEMDTALTSAEQRLATARNDHERLEAQVAVATILLHRGQLASAAALLEAVVRAGGAAPSPPGDGRPAPDAAVPPQGPARGTEPVVATARGWLALARFWAGDVDGAAALVGPGAGAGSRDDDRAGAALRWWVAAEVALVRDDSELVVRAVEQLRRAGRDGAAEAVEALLALARRDEEPAARSAAEAYRAAAVAGGFDLLIAAPPHAWCLARAGRWDEAAAVADELRRRLGPVDTCARLHADLVAQARAAHLGDVVAEARTARAIAATRRLGYAPVETAARRWLPAPPPSSPSLAPDRPRPETGGPGVAIRLLGPVTIRVDGKAVPDGAWRSRKAREVLLVLALAGDVGLSRDEVIEAVWPERDPVKGRTLLRTALTGVRQVLEPQRPPGEPSRFVVTRGDRVVVRARTDLAHAERLLASARRSPTEAGPDEDGALAALAAAWSLFQGPLAPDEAYTASLDEARRIAGRLRLDIADALIATTGTDLQRAAGQGARTPATTLPEPLPVAPDLLVAAATHVLAEEPWRTEVVDRVAAVCRASGHEAHARQAERLRPR